MGNISAAFLGQLIIGWTLIYLVTSVIVVKQLQLPRVALLVALVLVPFIPLTPVYLIVLVAMGIAKK